MAPGFNYKPTLLEVLITHLEGICIVTITIIIITTTKTATTTELINEGHNFKGIPGFRRNRWEL